MHISLPTNLKTDIEREVIEKRYDSSSEFFRFLVRDYFEKKRREHNFIAYVQEGRDSGISAQTPQETTAEARKALKEGSLREAVEAHTV